MKPAEVLGRLRQRGIVVVPAGDGQLRYSPKDLPSSAELAELERCRDAILELLERDPVGWRASVMVRQMTRAGATPLLLARPGIRFPAGTCCSCGDPLSQDDRYRCRPCVEAAVAALATVG